MSILDELLKSVETLPLDEQMKKVCLEIFKEEKKNIIDISDIPTGPNIFLAVQVPGIINKDICFICLERVSRGEYIVTLWAKQAETDTEVKRTLKWEAKSNELVKILKLFTDKVSFMRGQ